MDEGHLEKKRGHSTFPVFCGTFRLAFSGQTTAPIAYNATASTVDTALEALSTIGSGNVTVSGNAGPGAPGDRHVRLRPRSRTASGLAAIYRF